MNLENFNFSLGVPNVSSNSGIGLLGGGVPDIIANKNGVGLFSRSSILQFSGGFIQSQMYCAINPNMQIQPQNAPIPNSWGQIACFYKENSVKPVPSTGEYGELGTNTISENETTESKWKRPLTASRYVVKRNFENESPVQSCSDEDLLMKKIKLDVKTETHLKYKTKTVEEVTVYDYHHGKFMREDEPHNSNYGNVDVQSQLIALAELVTNKNDLSEVEGEVKGYPESLNDNDLSSLDSASIADNSLQVCPVWTLIPLDGIELTPLLKENINISKCSMKDPRLKHFFSSKK